HGSAELLHFRHSIHVFVDLRGILRRCRNGSEKNQQNKSKGFHFKLRRRILRGSKCWSGLPALFSCVFATKYRSSPAMAAVVMRSNIGLYDSNTSAERIRVRVGSSLYRITRPGSCAQFCTPIRSLPRYK